MEGTRVTATATYELVDPGAFTAHQATLFLYEDDVTWCCGYDYERHWDRVVRMVRSTPLSLATQGVPVVIEEVYEITEAVGTEVDVDNLHGAALFERISGDKAVIQATTCRTQDEWIPRLSFERRVVSAPEGSSVLLVDGSIRNLGSGDDVVDLSVEDAPGWPLSFRVGNDPSFLASATIDIPAGGEIPLVLRIETDDDRGVREGRLLAESTNGGQFRTAPIRIFNRSHSVFLADDDGFAGSEPPFVEFLDAEGYLYDVDDFPLALDGSELPGYDVVVWQTGTATSFVLAESEEFALTRYLEGGGALYLSSMDLSNGRASDDPFLTGVLGLDSWIPNTRATTVSGVPGDPITDGMVLPLEWPNPVLNRVDTLVPGPNAEAILRAEDEAPAAVRTTTADGGRIVYSSIWQSALPDSGSDTSHTLLARAFDWLLDPVPSEAGTPPGIGPKEFVVGPNPWMGREALRFRATRERSELQHIRIFDSAGRSIRSLTSAGGTMIEWDGRDERGHPVPTGLYLARAQFDHGKTAVSRFVRIR